MHRASWPYRFSILEEMGTDSTSAGRNTYGDAIASPPGTSRYRSTKTKQENVAGANGKNPVYAKLPKNAITCRM
jgi:hypothetical protein